MGESVERLSSKGGVVTGSRMEGTVTRWENKQKVASTLDRIGSEWRMVTQRAPHKTLHLFLELDLEGEVKICDFLVRRPGKFLTSRNCNPYC